MPPDTLTSADAAKEPPVLDTLKRFLPYLWPAGHTGHKVRIVGAGLIVLASKGVQLSMGFLYGAAIGLIILAIRHWGGYPDAVAFAVLLMNIAAPTIDYYTQPRVFGHGRREKT